MKSDSTRHNRIDYIEFPANSGDALAAAKKFYGSAFGWVYKDWSAEYSDTHSSGIVSGIGVDTSHQTQYPLVVIYTDTLEESRAKVLAAQGRITKDIFSFPGGRRFHFVDPTGKELAVWSEH